MSRAWNANDRSIASVYLTFIIYRLLSTLKSEVSQVYLLFYFEKSFKISSHRIFDNRKTKKSGHLDRLHSHGNDEMKKKKNNLISS